MTPRPTFDRAACVHTLSPQAGCADCIAACPHDAVSLAAAGIVIDMAACAGCGACVGACPPRALRIAPAAPPLRDGDAMVLVCRRHPQAAGNPAAAICIQSHGLSDLAQWALSGVRRLACATGECASCPDCPPRPMTTLTDRFAPVFAAQGTPMPVPTRATPDELRRWARGAKDGPAPARRALLRALARPLRPDEDDRPVEPPLARLQAGGGELFAFVPRIDARSCTGCDACLSICPESALALVEDGVTGSRYAVIAARCTGCLLCEDVCADDAIEVDGVADAPADIPLTSFACRACGVPVHVPTGGPLARSETCPICTATGHHKKLFQVLD